MYIKQDMDFNDLMENCWSGAVDTLRTIEENGKEDELITHLEEEWLEEDSYSDEGSLSSHCEPWLCEFCPHKCTCGL